MSINPSWSYILIAVLISTAPGCLAYDRVIDFEDSQNIIVTLKVYDYEKYVLTKFAKNVEKLDLPEDTKFTLVIRKNGRIKNIKIESEKASARATSWSTRALNRLRFKTIPDIESGTITIKISKNELMNQPYKHDSDVETMIDNKGILVPKEELIKRAKDEIEKLKNKKTMAGMPYSNLPTNCQIIDIALRNNMSEEIEGAVHIINEIASQEIGQHSNHYCPDLARTAEKLSKHKYFEEAVSVMCNAIRLQTNGDSYYFERPKLKFDFRFTPRCGTMRFLGRNATHRYSINQPFLKVERALRNNNQFALLSKLLEKRVDQLMAMNRVEYGLLALEKLDLSQSLLYQANQSPKEKVSLLKKSNDVFSMAIRETGEIYGFDSSTYTRAALQRRKDLNKLNFKHDEFLALP